MPQSISFTHNEDTDQFHVLIDGEDHGPVDMDDLYDEVNSLYIHFHLFRYAPEYDPDEQPETTEHNTSETLTDEEVDELIAEVEEIETEVTNELDEQDN